MNKADLVEKIAKDAGLSKAASEKALNAFTDGVKASLKKGQSVTLVGFAHSGLARGLQGWVETRQQGLQ